MTIQIKVNEGRVEAFEGNEEVGRLEFTLENSVMKIEHTMSYQEGKGIGRKLVMEAAEYAKDNGLKIKPVCSFAHAVLRRNEAYQNLLTEDADEGVSCRL
ncbi:MAG: N-acetyltransferase [Prevotella sp.]|nr:N-acetyltransferase [Prevotella sp.]